MDLEFSHFLYTIFQAFRSWKDVFAKLTYGKYDENSKISKTFPTPPPPPPPPPTRFSCIACALCNKNFWGDKVHIIAPLGHILETCKTTWSSKIWYAIHKVNPLFSTKQSIIAHFASLIQQDWSKKRLRLFLLCHVINSINSFYSLVISASARLSTVILM